MDATTLATRRADLEAQRAGHVGFLAEHGADPYGEDVRDLKINGEGFADAAQATEERAELLGHIEAARHRVRLIDEALERIEEGSYGICVACGEPISEDRLEVRPLSVRCVGCAEA